VTQAANYYDEFCVALTATVHRHKASFSARAL